MKRRRSELTAEVIALRRFRHEALAVLKFIVVAYDADKKRMLANGIDAARECVANQREQKPVLYERGQA